MADRVHAAVCPALPTIPLVVVYASLYAFSRQLQTVAEDGIDELPANLQKERRAVVRTARTVRALWHASGLPLLMILLACAFWPFLRSYTAYVFPVTLINGAFAATVAIGVTWPRSRR